MASYFYYIFLAIILVALGILSMKKGFWEMLVKSVAVILASLTAMSFLLPFGEILDGISPSTANFNQIIAVVALFIVSLAFSIALLAIRPSAKNFFSKKTNTTATLVLLVIMGGAGFFAIQKLASFNQAAAEGPASADAPAKASLRMNDELVAGAASGTGTIVTMYVCFLLWGWTGAWICSDGQKLKLPSAATWNLCSVLIFPIALVLSAFMPSAWIVAPILLTAYGVPTLCYVRTRNAGLEYKDKVLTLHHIGTAAAHAFKLKKASKTDDEPEWALPIELFGWGKKVSKQERQERAAALKQLAGCNALCELVYRALKCKATAFRFEFDGRESQAQFLVDGVWNPANGLFRKLPAGDDATRVFEAAKTICGVEPTETQARQTGQFYMEYDKKRGKKKKMAASMTVQGKGSGEEMSVQFEYLHLRFGTLEKLGMSETRCEQVKKLLQTDTGLLVFCAPPDHGLRTLTNAALNVSDRFTRDFVTVEDVEHPYFPIENVQLNTYDSSKGQTPMNVLPDVLFRDPRVLVLRDTVNKEALELCCREASEARLVIITIRAKDSAEAICKLLQSGVDPKLLADTLVAVISQRLVRILCPKCKEETPARPEVLRRLGISPSFVSCLWKPKAHTPYESGRHGEPLCQECMDFGFKKRMGIYDVITVTDEIRKMMTNQATEEKLRAAAVKAGERGFLPEGARMVAWGATSFEELVRCLK